MFVHRHRTFHWVLLCSVRGTGTYQPTRAGVMDDFGNFVEVRYVSASFQGSH